MKVNKSLKERLVKRYFTHYKQTRLFLLLRSVGSKTLMPPADTSCFQRSTLGISPGQAINSQPLSYTAFTALEGLYYTIHLVIG